MTSNIKYPLATSTWGKEEIAAINRVVGSDRYTMGREVEYFEREFAEYIGSRYAVMVNSGSSANLLMIAALIYTGKIKRGDEVIVPAVSWGTTYSPLEQFGLKLRFVDIDIDTLNAGESGKVVFAVNLLGNPCEFDKIDAGILIEDNCESMGAKYKGRYTGTFGIMGSFSTFFSHHICTMEGGLVVTDDELMYHTLLSLRSHGWTRHLPGENMLVTKDINPFKESFRFILPGYNLRPGEMHGAIGREQLKKMPEFIRARRNNAEIFKSYFNTQKEVGESSWFGFSMIRKDRDQVLKRLEKSGIECRPIVAGNFLKNDVIKYFNYTSDPVPNADVIDRYGLFVGNHNYDLEKEIRYLYNIIGDGCDCNNPF